MYPKILLSNEISTISILINRYGTPELSVNTGIGKCSLEVVNFLESGGVILGVSNSHSPTFICH